MIAVSRRGALPLTTVVMMFAFASVELVAQAQPPAGAPPSATAAGRGGAAQPRGRGGIRVMTLTSSAFADGTMIPAKHAQSGHDVSPPLSWSGAPDSTQSFVLVVHDLDAASGDGTDDALHWLVWNIPGSSTSLAEGIAQGSQAPTGLRQISITGPNYRGPAAPSTGPAHHYVFELYALDSNINVAAVGLSPAATRAAVMSAMASHVRGKGVLVGLYKRPAP